jgi:TolB-like protein/thioredoxin-like negative regulator of GroEL
LPNEPGLSGETSSGGTQRAVFLSYASEDADAAQRVCASLRAAGIEVWFDQNALRGGDAWDVAIRRQIKSCALFVPIISANTRARVEGYFRLEWKLAVDRSHLIAAERAFLLPIVIDDTREGDALVPDRFRELQWTRLPAGETPPAFVARVAELLAHDERNAAGIERTAPAAAANPPHPPHVIEPPAAAPSAWTRPALLLVSAALLIAAGFYAVDRFVASRRSAAAMPAAPAVQTAESAASAAPDKSIAVLPFVDMSEKHDQEYFSDGLAEELLDVLAKVPGLQVIARTSSFSFKGKSEDVPTIAKKLHVANVLEGSVRKSGRHLRITTQLIRADTGVHIWSETYDRDEEDVFKVQEDISRAVVEKLKVALLGDVPVSAARTSNPEAYNLLLQGRYFVAFDTPDELKKAIDCYRRAIALDAAYAPAWAGLSNAIFRQVANGYVPVGAGQAQALATAHKAAELDPSLADAYAMIGTLKMNDCDWSGAREAFDHALQLDPNNLKALFSSAHLTMAVGNTDDTLAQFRDVLERDPLNLLYRRYVARVLYYAGRLTEAEAMIRQVLAMSPSFPAAHYELGRILLARGEIPAAMAEFEAEQSSWRPNGLPLGFHALGRAADANAALAAQVKDSAGAEFQAAETYAYFGDSDNAFHWLDQAVLKHDPGIQWLRGDPMLKGLVHDPRYAALLQRLKLPP